MSKTKVRKKADVKKLTVSTELYDRLFACAMNVWEIEKEQLATDGICPEAKKHSGMTDKEIVKSIQSNPPCPETITTMAVTALEKKIEEHNNLKASSQTLH